MKDTIINLTPPIDGVQYGISTELIKEGDWHLEDVGKFGGGFDIIKCNHFGDYKGGNKKIHFSTNLKDTRFPYLVMSSKEQEVERLAVKKVAEFKSGFDGLLDKGTLSLLEFFFIQGFNANPAKYTQEQMEKAIFQAKLGTQLTVTERYSGEDGVDNLTNDILQSLQPTAKAVVVEMEESYIEADAWGSPVIKYKMKVETSSEHSQGIVRVIEVIY